MKIAVDARELIGRPTGVGRYLAEQIACWSRDPLAAAHTFILMAPEPLSQSPATAASVSPAAARPSDSAPMAPPLPPPMAPLAAYVSRALSRPGLPAGLIGTGGARIETRVVPITFAAGGQHWWEQRTLPAAAAAAGADVLFCPNYSGPLLSRVPMVVTIHDVSFWAHPEWFHWREGLRRRWMSWAAARRARLVLTMTKFSRDEVLRWIGAKPERVRAIHNGVGGIFDPMDDGHGGATATAAAVAAATATPTMTQTPTQATTATTPAPRTVTASTLAGAAAIGPAAGDGPRTVLTVGSIFNRRHVDLLIRAIARVAADLPDVRLVVVGENRTHPYQDLAALARELKVANRVDLRVYVSDEELRGLYRDARAFAFLSTYEGFGLTPLEAIVAGVPTVVADTEVAREVNAGLAHLVPAGDVEALAERLRAMLTEPRDPARQAALARAARARYPWNRTAAATLEALGEAARPLTPALSPPAGRGRSTQQP